MVQTANLRKGDYLTHLRGLDAARFRTIVIKRAVGPRLMIVRDVATENSSQVLFAKDNHVVGALAPYRAN